MLTGEHIADDVLLDFAEDRADTATAARVRQHLDTGCTHCATELTFWSRALSALEADRAPAPPAVVLQAAFALFDRLAPKKTTLWQRVVATLAFDSRVQPALAGARDTGGASFQLLFEAEGADIDLLCERGQRGWHITGQALSTNPPELGWKVLATSEAGRIETDTDPLGEFRLHDLAPGVYELALRDVNHEIVLPNIELQAV
jgi:hypothetical protein